MRKLLFTFACLCVLASLARAQDPTYPTTYSRGGNLTTSSANCDPTACLGIGLPTPSAAVITVGLTGTWSGTLAVEESQDGGRTFTSAGASLTSTGTSTYVIAGFTSFRVRAGTLSSGNVGVNFTVSNAPSGGVTSGTGAPSGSCTANQIYVNQSNGNLYTCSAGSWVLSGGGGSGTVTSVSFTGGLISVATPTTTPALTVAGTSGGIPYFSGAAAWASSAAGTVNTLIKWGGAGNPPIASSITDNGTTVSTTEPFSATALTCGVLNTTSCVITGFGSTSGSATITWPAVAGTANQAIAFSNAISSAGGVTATGQVLAGAAQAVGFNTRSLIISGADGTLGLTNNAGTGFTKLTIGPGTSSFPALCNSGTTLLVGLANATCTTLAPLSASAITGSTFNTGTNCSSSASPAVCAAAAGGSVAIPAGALQTLQVNTTAVTANSQILLTIDEGLGTKLGVTCNTTVATLTQPVVTARTAGSSFTIEEPATTSVNPVCVSYMVFN